MFVRWPFPRKLALVVGSLFVVYALVGWLALPRILQSQAEQYIAEKTGHRLSLDRPEFNPFTLNLRLSNLRLQEPDGKPLFAFRELKIDLSISSLYRRALIFDAIRLDAPEATVVLQRDGRLNWSALIDALAGKEEKPDSALPRLSIQSFILTGGQLDFADNKARFTTRVSPLDLELSDISTLPNDKGRYEISARTGFGARIFWQGQTTLNPLAIAGSLAIENLDLAPLSPYFKGVLPVPPPLGVASLSTDYGVTYAGGRFDLSLKNAAAQVTNFRLSGTSSSGPMIAINAIDARNGRFDLSEQKFVLGTLTLSGTQIDLPQSAGPPAPLLKFRILTLEDMQVDMAERNIMIDRIALDDGQVRAVRKANGHIDVLDAFRAAIPPATGAKPAAKTATPPWHYGINRLELDSFAATFRDEGVAPAADLVLDDIALRLEGISDNLSMPLPVRASFHAKDGGQLDVFGQIIPAEPSADLHLKLVDLGLKPAQPYIASVAKLRLTNGQLNMEGRAIYGKQGARYTGNFAVRNLRLVEAGTNEVFLAWKFLGSRRIEVTPAKLDIVRLDVSGLDTKLIINKDKSININEILRKPAQITVSSPPAPAPAVAVAATPEMKTKSFLVDIDRVKITEGEMDFADYSLILPFEAHIHSLHGFINSVSSLPATLGQIELDGQIDDHGIARAVGQAELLNPTDLTDVKVTFSNVEMTRLTPYSTTFAGRRIDSGKLLLNLEYKINKHQLQGDNEIVINKLTLGEHVKSPDAVDLPLDLAIAILEDSDGRIDLGLPVSGSLDDPQFSYGKIVWKAILNLFKMIATAPFRALASLFGGGTKIENVYFDAGDTNLSPPARENIIQLAGVLNKRPLLSVTVHGTYSDADRVALQDLQLRRAVAAKAGQHVEGREDPGPISTSSPKVQDALESLFSRRIGSAELAALKEGFRKANPGQMEEGVAGKIMSRLSGLFRKPRTLNEHEVDQLKGADFFTVLFQRLREREPVSDAQLESLGKARGENTYESLKSAGAPADRLVLGAPEKGDSDAQGVPLKFDLGTAPKPAVPAPVPTTSPSSENFLRQLDGAT